MPATTYTCSYCSRSRLPAEPGAKLGTCRIAGHVNNSGNKCPAGSASLAFDSRVALDSAEHWTDNLELPDDEPVSGAV